MDAQQFLTEFGHIASAPNGVQRLRGLVLTLALRGELTERTVGESARTLLAAIEEVRPAAKGARAGKMVLDVYDPPHEIPDNWVWVRFGAIAIHNSGKTLDTSRNSGELRKYITTSNLYWGRFDLSTVREMRIREDEIGKCSARKGDLLICEGGEAGRAAVWDREEEVCFQNHVHRARFHGGVNPFFVLLIFQKLSYTGEISAFRKGIGISNMSSSALASIPVPLPPLIEQERVVAKVDELMALCDRLEALQNKRKAARAVLTKEILGRASDTTVNAQTCLQNLSLLVSDVDQIPVLRQTILSLAVQGKLVPQDPREEAAQDGLQRLGVDSKLFLKNDQLPLTWRLIPFQGVAEVTGGVTLGRNLKKKVLVRLPYLRVANVKRGEVDVSTMKDVDIGEDEIERYSLKAGDVLMTEGGDWDKVGRAAIWNNELPICLHQNHVFRARLRSDELMPLWFERYFNSPIGRAYFEGAAKQTTNLASINMRQVRGCPVPVPPLAEQKRIVAKVDELMALCDTLEATLRKASQVQDQLAISSIAALTGIQSQEKETMKAPKTELVARLKIGKMPTTKDQAPLASLLVRHNNELSPNVLHQHSGLDIDAFYRQLKIEMIHGWIVQPEVPSMRLGEHR